MAAVPVALLLPLPLAWRILIALAFALLVLRGILDLLQTRRAVLRNYPIIGHARYLIERIRPELRQYLFETDFEKMPFSRSQRALVYARAKGEPDQRPFGTLEDAYALGHEFIAHSLDAIPAPPIADFRVTVGSSACTRPYSASILNISAMSFGSLSANAIKALNKGAAMGGFMHDTGEGSVSPHHLEHGGDLVWQIASGYFGCRDENGRFSPDRFARTAADERIKMIEIKLSQGAKPGHGGILPAHKVSAEIAATRGIPKGVECVSPPRHSAFGTPLELMAFVSQLRGLSGGKPVGIKLAIGQPSEFMGIVKAMIATGTVVDFVVVDGSEGGTGAAPLELSDHAGVPMRDALLLVHNALMGAGLRDQVRIGVAGRIVSAFDIAAVMAMGADWVNSARGFMFAIGCIQSQSCHTNKCPTGVATQDAGRQRALVVEDKSARVANFHRNTLQALAELIATAGLAHPSMLRPHHVTRRVSTTELRPYSDIYPFLEEGALLSGSQAHPFYAEAWTRAKLDSFS